MLSFSVRFRTRDKKWRKNEGELIEAAGEILNGEKVTIFDLLTISAVKQE